MKSTFWLNIALLLSFFVIESCQRKNHESAIAIRMIPNIYLNVNEAGFAYVQDTVYYKQKHFSGFQFDLYPNGDTSVIKSFYNGLEEGNSVKFYPNKQLAEFRFYSAGKKEGIHKAWWPNKKLKFVYAFSDDEFNGTAKEWYENGMPYKEFSYKDGHENGSIKMWWINGKMRTNYVVKNGRRYGLLGTKNCINVADSVAFDR